MPADGVGARVHYVWLVNAAVDAEAELVIADAAAPIRLRRGAHGAHGDGTESPCRIHRPCPIDQCNLPALERLEPSKNPPPSMPALSHALTKSSPILALPK